ncbi:hypothetical protein [Streptodolium elevatio]
MSRIVAVHGVGNHVRGGRPDAVAEAVAADWSAGLAAGLGLASLGKADLTCAYYAHHLYRGKPVAQGTDDQALDRLATTDPDAAALAEMWLDAHELPEVVAQGRLTVPLRHAVDMLARRFSLDGRLTRLFMALVFREVATYLKAPDAPARQAARDEVGGVLDRERPTVVLAHSLGSVVAYEALHARQDVEIDLLVTMGSPLALRHGVFERLTPAPVNGLGERPPNVRRWVNVADPGDPVAILRPLSRWFPGVDLDLTDSINLFDFHLAANYLRSAAVAAAVAPYLGVADVPPSPSTRAPTE